MVVIDKLGRSNVLGDEGHWWTPEMAAGTETVEEHLVSGHNVSQAEVSALSFEAAHELHDRLHAEAHDNEILALMETVGFPEMRRA